MVIYLARSLADLTRDNAGVIPDFAAAFADIVAVGLLVRESNPNDRDDLRRLRVVATAPMIVPRPADDVYVLARG